jgi:hypothetical protein
MLGWCRDDLVMDVVVLFFWCRMLRILVSWFGLGHVSSGLVAVFQFCHLAFVARYCTMLQYFEDDVVIDRLAASQKIQHKLF